jgi:hypothetical protein
MSLDTAINIISLEELKTYFEGSTTGSTTNDEKLNQLINGVSDYFNKYCGRTIKLTEYSPELPDYDGNGTANMYLNNWPISTSGATVYIDESWAFTTDTIATTSDINASTNDGRLHYRGIFPAGYQNIRVYYSGGYSSSQMPHDLKRAAMEMCQFWWNRETKKDRVGVRNEQFEGGSRTFETDMPWSVVKVLEYYKGPRYG